MEYALEIIGDWQEGDEISEVETAFSIMDHCDQANNKELWIKLRNAFRKNKDLNQDYMTSQLCYEPNVKDNH